jgi:hypothetical protein
VDARFISKGSLLRVADSNGDYDVYFAKNDADDSRNRSFAGENDDVDACDVDRLFPECLQRIEPIFSLQ